jgi:two-component system response regulator YesN
LGLSNLEQRIIDLKDLVNSSFIYNRGVIMEQSMIEQFKSSVIEYPFGLENRIRKEIINGNYKRAEEIGEQFRKLIIESNSSPKYIREYTARFSSSIYNVAKEYMPELETKSTFHYFINNIIESKSKQELINNYEKILYAVLDYNDTQMEINNKIVQKAINFIRNNYHRDITLSETAELVGVTPEYLSKLFYQEMNINFVVFLKNFRISVAKRLLLQENFRIQDIAEHVGFKDPKYFNKVFKSVCGVTPSEYKKVI